MSAKGTHEHSQDPRVGEPVPTVGDAYIDRAKLIAYGLDPEHPVGKHKALVFNRALNIGRADWKYLRDTILDELPRHPVTASREPADADETYTWDVLVPIRGLGTQSERRLQVITAWEIREGRPELVTIRVAPKNRRQASDSG